MRSQLWVVYEHVEEAGGSARGRHAGEVRVQVVCGVHEERDAHQAHQAHLNVLELLVGVLLASHTLKRLV